MTIPMLDRHPATVLRFPASAQWRTGSSAREGATIGSPMAKCDAALHGMPALSDNVIVLADFMDARARRAGSFGFFPSPGGDAA